MEAEDGGLAQYQGHLPYRRHPTACNPRMAMKAGGRWGVQSPLLTPGGVQEGLTPFPHLKRVNSVSGLSDQSPASTDRSLNWANNLQSQDPSGPRGRKVLCFCWIVGMEKFKPDPSLPLQEAGRRLMRETQIRTTRRHHLTPTRMTVIKKI